MKPYFISILLLIAVITACKPEPKIPKWDVEALTPLVSTRIEVRDFIADSTLSADPNGLLSLVYQNKLATVLPDEIISPLNASFENVIKLKDIDLGTPTIKDAISLGYLCRSGTPAGQFIIFNNGKKAIIPPFNTTNKKSFTIDATNIFQSITLIDGQLTVEFYNDLPLTVTGVEFDLKNKVSGTTLVQKTIDTLKAQETYTESFSLSGQTIEGQLETTLKKLGTPGSGADSIIIDTSRKIFITVSLENLQPSSATAIFPDQVLANDTTDTEIKTGAAQLTRVKVGGGSIFLNATSTIEDVIDLDYSIPGAAKGSNTLEILEKIPAAPPGATSTQSTQLGLADYEIDLTGRPSYANVYNTFYTILLGRIDSSGNLINLSLQDSVLLNTGIQNLTAKEGYGYLGKDTTHDNSANKVSLFGELHNSRFDLDDVRMMLAFENSIGAPIDIIIGEMLASTATNPSNISSGNSTALSWAGIGNTETIPAATLSPAPLPVPKRLELYLDKTNSNLDELIELNPRYFKTDVTAYINGPLNSPDYKQFIFSDYGIDVSLNMEIPLHLSADDIHLSDTMAFDYSNLDKDGQLQNGLLRLIARNRFPFGGSINIHILSDEGVKLTTLYTTDVLKPAPTDGSGKSIEELKTVMEYPLGKDQVAALKKAAHIVMDIHLNTPAGAGKVKVYDDDYLDLTLSGDLTIRSR